MDLRDIGWACTDWTDVSQDRDQWKALVNTVRNIMVCISVGNLLSSCATGGFSRRAQLYGVS
jgi:DNA phosphorothioation-dependent restriction protein DptG